MVDGVSGGGGGEATADFGVAVSFPSDFGTARV